ncbi:MAG: hypothetical protein HKN09_06775 [Saprospiraceae bacterium]|nr:hypothetical protein [Saprospiraceae bacterium]
MKNKNFALITSFIGIAALFRLFPHPPNVTPVAAMAFVGGAYFTKKYWGFLLPIIALFLSDLVINNTIARPFFTDHVGFVFFSDYMIPVYIAFVLTAAIGMVMHASGMFKKIVFGALFSSIAFFFITNIGSWMSSAFYPKTFAGLLLCLEAGVPFFRNTAMGNLMFFSVIILAIEAIKSYVLKPQAA